MKLSFKKEPKATGLAHVANPYAGVEIKGDEKRVGTINPPFRNEWKWSVSFMIKDSEHRLGWRHVNLKWRGDTEEEARDFVKRVWDDFQMRYELYQNDY